MTGDVWAAWREHRPGRAAMAKATGWPPAQIATIDAYRDQRTRYCFPTVDLLQQAYTGAGFLEIARIKPSYELGERCPTFVLAPG